MPDPTPTGGPIREGAAPFEASPHFSALAREALEEVFRDWLGGNGGAIDLGGTGDVVALYEAFGRLRPPFIVRPGSLPEQLDVKPGAVIFIDSDGSPIG